MKIVKLGDVCEFDSGFAFSSEYFSRDEGIGLIRIRDIKNGYSTETNYVGEFDEKYLVHTGDYLIGMDGEFRCYEWKGAPALLNQRVCRLREDQELLDPRYFFYGINKYLKEIEDVTTFTTVKHISVKQIRDIDFVLPSIEEQRKIVKRLDAMFEKIDKAIENTDKNLKNSDLLFGSLLNDIIHHSSNVESKMMGEISDVEYGLTERAKITGDLRFVRITDINSEGFLNSENTMYIEASPKAKQYLLNDGDLVVARTGATFGKVLYFNEQAPSVFASYLIRINFKEDIHPKLFWYYAKTPQYWEQANALSGGAAQPQFNGNALKQIRFSYPNRRGDQQVMVEKLDTYHRLTLKLKSVYQQKLNSLQELKQSLLKQAFSGSGIE